MSDFAHILLKASDGVLGGFVCPLRSSVSSAHLRPARSNYYSVPDRLIRKLQIDRPLVLNVNADCIGNSRIFRVVYRRLSIDSSSPALIEAVEAHAHSKVCKYMWAHERKGLILASHRATYTPVFVVI